MLVEEVSKFEAVARGIALREARRQDAILFKAEQRQQLMRLAELGALAHKSAIASYRKVSDEERAAIIESIMQRKAGSKPKKM